MKGSTNASARPNIRIQDASAEFVANTDTSTNAEFPYRASVSITGVTRYMSATVIYSQAQCISGAYSTYCQTYDGGVYLYAKTDVGTQTIPAISCDISVNYINVENVPTSGSQSVITSGGVYTALAGKVSGSGDIGTDFKPIKIVNGQAVAVTNPLMSQTESQIVTGFNYFTHGCLCVRNPNSDRNIPAVLNFYDLNFVDATGQIVGTLRFQDNADGVRQLHIGFWEKTNQQLYWVNLAGHNCN